MFISERLCVFVLWEEVTPTALSVLLSDCQIMARLYSEPGGAGGPSDVMDDAVCAAEGSKCLVCFRSRAVEIPPEIFLLHFLLKIKKEAERDLHLRHPCLHTPTICME